MFENLTDQQKQFLRKNISHLKFTVMTAELGCAVQQIRDFANVVFEERQAEAAKRVGEAARIREAEEQEYNRQLAELKAMHQDNAVLRAFWDKHHHDAARDEWESCNRDEIGWEVQDNMKDEIFERIEEAVQEAWLGEPVEEAFEEWLNEEGFLHTLGEKVEAN